jgi:hypothetical protein
MRTLTACFACCALLVACGGDESRGGAGGASGSSAPSGAGGASGSGGISASGGASGAAGMSFQGGASGTNDGGDAELLSCPEAELQSPEGMWQTEGEVVMTGCTDGPQVGASDERFTQLTITVDPLANRFGLREIQLETALGESFRGTVPARDEPFASARLFGPLEPNPEELDVDLFLIFAGDCLEVVVVEELTREGVTCTTRTRLLGSRITP